MSGFSVKYTNGFEVTQETLRALFNNEVCSILEHKQQLCEFLEEGLKDYSSIGRQMDFRDNTGVIISLPRITYGTTINTWVEADVILGALQSQYTISDRVPTMRFVESDFIGDALIEIDKSQSMLYYRYRNRINLEIPITDGLFNKDSLENGIYYVTSKHECRTFFTGNQSQNNVRRIRLGLNGNGAGIHNLGYIDNPGSISIEPKYAEKLYDAIQVNTPVFIH